MSTTITGKLNKAATQFQAGESVGFGVRIGVKYYDRETKQNEWTNYECVIFAKAQGQVQFYQEALVEGSIIEITGKEQKIKQFQGQNGLSLSIEILNASIGFVGKSALATLHQLQDQSPQQQQQQQPNGIIPARQQQQAPGYNGGQPMQQPATANGGQFGQPANAHSPADFGDDSIPF